MGAYITSSKTQCPLSYPVSNGMVYSVYTCPFGIEVSASYKTINTASLYDIYFGYSTTLTAAEVFLVTCDYGNTDPLESSPGSAGFDGGLKPRLLPIKAIPWVAFRHLGGREGRESAKHMSDVWDYAFKNAFNAFRSPQVMADGLVLLPVQADYEVIHSDHKDVLRSWNPQLWKVLGNPMRHFLPPTPSLADEIRQISDLIFSQRADEAIYHGGYAAANWYYASTIFWQQFTQLCASH